MLLNNVGPVAFRGALIGMGNRGGIRLDSLGSRVDIPGMTGLTAASTTTVAKVNAGRS